ncbi:MAG: hypothetical protein PHI12_10990 [Dehalococcoidales bacterium]|nr:hypothetical protein [Dehalococcoidales bacterium]
MSPINSRQAARDFLSRLSISEVFALGDDLVLGQFDWREWGFSKKPDAVFMNELDRQRIYIEEMA